MLWILQGVVGLHHCRMATNPQQSGCRAKRSVRTSRMTANSKMRLNVALAALAGLGLRLFFVLRFPSTGSGDAPFYIEFAWNWLKSGVYGGIGERATRAPGRAPARLSGVSGRDFQRGREFIAGSYGDAGSARSRDVFCDRADRGAAGSGSFTATSRNGRFVAGGAVPLRGQLRRRGDNRNAGHVPDGACDPRAARDGVASRRLERSQAGRARSARGFWAA